LAAWREFFSLSLVIIFDIMHPAQDLVKQLKTQYFWDVDRNFLDDNNSKRLIIERVFSLGTIEEINLIISYYGREETKRVICKLHYLDPKTLNFASKFLNLRKKEFACYTRRRLHQIFWNS
jgi:hypothetical protein